MAKTPVEISEAKGFDALIEQRAEAIEANGRTFTVPGFGRDWQLVAPDLATNEWKEEFQALQEDARDGLVDLDELSDAFVDLFLGDEADAFLDAFDAAAADKELGISPLDLITAALRDYQEERSANPTRGRSRRTRKRAKRR